MEEQINIAIVDDHHLFRSGIINLIKKLSTRFSISIEANNGKDFLDKLLISSIPDIVLLDISMPIMDGYKTAEELKIKYPKIKILVLSMNDDAPSLIRMLRIGVKGFVGKDLEPDELKDAIISVNDKGYYHTELMAKHLVGSYQNFEINKVENLLTENELKFLKMSCSEDTYAQIAEKMCLSPRTIHGYRDSVFSKLKLNTRLGLILFSIKIKLVILD
tara:strand:+ start:1827 stop:2480 length:654 start_codon:yes stop_codon:yes gene_type:complete